MPIAVATTSAEFNAHSKDISARFLEVHQASSFPIKIYTVAIPSTNLRSVTLPGSISVEFRHTYPTSFSDHGMNDLKPSSYAALATRIQANEVTALHYLESSRLNSAEITALSQCNEVCRTQTACQLLYSVNEFTMLCLGYDFNYADSWYYFLGAMSNPWFYSHIDETVPAETTTT